MKQNETQSYESAPQSYTKDNIDAACTRWTTAEHVQCSRLQPATHQMPLPASHRCHHAHHATYTLQRRRPDPSQPQCLLQTSVAEMTSAVTQEVDRNNTACRQNVASTCKYQVGTIHRVTVAQFLHTISVPALFPPWCGASPAKCSLLWHHFLRKIVIIWTSS